MSTFVILKRLFAILLISLHLISTTELSELLKVPVLIEHFVEHKSLDSEVTLFSFLHMHYAHGNVLDADYDKDMRLPFKSHEGCLNLGSLICLPPYAATTTETVLSSNTQHFPIQKITFISSAYLSSIWQPPKSC